MKLNKKNIILASILGLILGKYVLGSFFLNMEAQYFEIPVYNTILISSVYILALIVVVLITIVTYLSCRGILKESAVDALRTEIPKVKNTKFDLTTKGIFKKSSISTRWNLRDIGRNKSRSIMAVVGIIGCTMLLVCAFGMLDTMNSYLDWEFNKISNFEYKLSLSNNYTNEQLEKLTDKYGNSTSETLGIEIKNGDKKEENKDVVFTVQTANQKETNKYNISATIPKINIDANYADKINAQIKSNYTDKIESIITGKNENETDYSVTYKAYLNGDLLSLIIKETIREGKNTQAVKIKTYNYNLNNNTEVSILDLVDAKGYTQKNLQKEIDAELKDLEKKDEELKNQFSDVRLRDLSSSMYKIENTENFIVNDNGFLYLIYAYGNTENTNKMDVIIFE